MPVVVCYSGGIDSTVLLWDVLRNPHRFNVGAKEDVYALSFDFGTAADKAGKRVRDRQFIQLNRAANGRLFRKTLRCNIPRAKVDADNGPPDRMPVKAEDEIKGLFIPGRHAYIGLAACIFAASVGAAQVLIAAVKSGVPQFDTDEKPTDATVEFNLDLMDAIEPSFCMCDPAPEIIMPYRYISKADVVRIGLGLSVDFNETNSCEYGFQCGRCAQCVSATRAMKEAEV